MTRVIAALWLVTAAVTAWGLFQVKAEVQRLEAELKTVRKATAADRESIDILRAEWNFLNQLETLAELSERYLGLAPIQPSQVVPLADLAERLNPQPDSTAPDGTESPAGAATLASAKVER